MKQIKFQPGDEVFHVSNPKMIMAVESVCGEEIYCSWIDPKTSEKREGNFSSISIRKVDNGPRMKRTSILI